MLKTAGGGASVDMGLVHHALIAARLLSAGFLDRALPTT